MKRKGLFVIFLAMVIGLYLSFACSTDDDDNDDNNNDSNLDDDDNDNDNDDTSSSMDDDSGDDTDDDTSDYCSEHQGDDWEPALFSTTLLVNGEEVEMPATVHLSDTLALAIEYEDPDCNLIGGRITINPNPNEIYRYEIEKILPGAYILEDIGCSSNEEGEPYNLSLDTNNFYFPSPIIRSYPLILYMSDVCGNINDKEEAQYLDFTVVEDYRAD